MQAYSIRLVELKKIPINILTCTLLSLYKKNDNTQLRSSYPLITQISQLKLIPEEGQDFETTKSIIQRAIFEFGQRMNLQVFDENIATLICYQIYCIGKQNQNGAKCLVSGFISLFAEEHFQIGQKLIDFVYRLDEVQISKSEKQESRFQSLIQYHSFLPAIYSHQMVKKYVNSLLSHKSPEAYSEVSQFILKKYLPIYASNPTQTAFLNIKQFLQIPSPLQQQQQSIISIFKNQYLKLIYGNSPIQATKTPFWMFMNLKMIELFHVADPSWKISQQFLGSSQLSATKFKSHIYSCLCDNETKGASVLVINIYASILRELDSLSKQTQLFIDLYLTLDSYGTHLIKDVWPNFYQICKRLNTSNFQQSHTLQISVFDLLHCLLNKISTHTNNNIPKYCIQALLQQKSETYSLFQYLPDTLYISLPQILNNGAHYHDCTLFHHDSKMYPLIREYYLEYFWKLFENKKLEQLAYHQKTLLQTINQYITFEHAVVAYSGILKDMPCVYELNEEDFEKLIEILTRFYRKLTIRKKYALLNNICCFVGNNLQNCKHITLYQLLGLFVGLLPDSQDICMSHDEILEKLKISQNFKEEQFAETSQTSYTAYEQSEGILKNCKEEGREIQIIEKLRKICYINIISTKLLNKKSDKHFSDSSLHQKIFTEIPQLNQSTYFYQFSYEKILTALSQFFKYGLSSPSSFKLLSLLIFVTKYFDQMLATHQNVDTKIGLLIINHSIHSVKQSLAVDESTSAIAKLIEYSIKKITSRENTNKKQALVYEQVLVNVLKSKIESTVNYEAIQSCLYQLYDSIKQKSLTLNISVINKLRIEILLFQVLTHDKEFILRKQSEIKKYQEDIGQYCEIYDYEHYEQLYEFISTLANLCQGTDIQIGFVNGIISHMKQVLENMLHNLDYGVHRKEVVSASQCVVNLAFISNFTLESVQLIKFLLVEVGQRYWGLQRHITFLILKNFSHQKLLVFSKSPENFFNILLLFIDMEEYRGEDSALLLIQHKQQEIYGSQCRLHQSADYDGSTLRLATILWLHRTSQKIIKYHKNDKEMQPNIQIIDFHKAFIKKCLNICRIEANREKMFLTGSHKTKIKIWQALIIFTDFIEQFCTETEIQQILEICLQIMGQNNLVEVKHYAEIFMLRLIYTKKPINFQPLCQKLRDRILEIYGQTNLVKNITYVVISGLILQIYFHQRLYTALFASICSHIAYFRGLSQFFCYQLIHRVKSEIKNPLELSTIEILFREFQKDEDAIKLTSHIQQIVKQYKQKIRNWNLVDDLLSQKVTLNGQIVSDSYYIEKFKRIGQKLTKQNKNEDGFMPYKQIWKKIAQPSTQQLIQEEQKLESFQKKIDPSLDDLYDFEVMASQAQKSTKMKIYVISAKGIPIYGHLARLGQILGLQNLCIPDIDIIALDEFKSVSCTAQKWLNITCHGFTVQIPEKKQQTKNSKKNKPKEQSEEDKTMKKAQKLQKLIDLLNEDAEKGYQIFRMEKSISNETTNSLEDIREKLPPKLALLVDEMNSLQELGLQKGIGKYRVPLYYSTHVGCTVILWEYYRKYILESQS